MAGEFIADVVFDSGLTYITTNASALHICSQAPTSYTEATTTYSLGSKSSPSVGSPEDGATSGRRVVVDAITDGTVSSNGTATHWALVYAGGTVLLAAGPLAGPDAVTTGNPFTVDAISITLRDATVT